MCCFIAFFKTTAITQVNNMFNTRKENKSLFESAKQNKTLTFRNFAQCKKQIRSFMANFTE
jgi:hypothetical protein